MAEHQTNKTLQLLQTILVSFLIGCTTWLAMAVIQTRDENITMRVQAQERLKRLEKIEDMLDNTIKTQQEVLRTLIQQKATDSEMTLRIEHLEKGKP